MKLTIFNAVLFVCLYPKGVQLGPQSSPKTVTLKIRDKIASPNVDESETLEWKKKYSILRYLEIAADKNKKFEFKASYTSDAGYQLTAINAVQNDEKRRWVALLSSGDYSDLNKNVPPKGAIIIFDRVPTGTTGSTGIVLPAAKTQRSEPVNKTLCFTSERAVAACRIYESLDTTVNPCDDFYAYACGNWPKKHPIPKGSSMFDTISVLDADLPNMLRDLLEKPSGPNELKPVTKAKMYYMSCMDEDLIQRRGLEPISYLSTVFGGWPLLDSKWDEDSYNLEKLLIKVRQYGSSPIVKLDLNNDYKNSKRLLKVGSPKFMIPNADRYDIDSETSISAFRKYLKSTAVALGATDNDQLNKDVEDVIKLETSMTKLINPSEQSYRVKPGKFFIKELSTKITDKFDWLEFIKGFMVLPGIDIDISGEETILLRSPTYLKKVFGLVKATPNRTVVNYILASEILSRLQHLPKDIKSIQKNFKKAIGNYYRDDARPRWIQCVVETSNTLNNAVGRMFVDKHFDLDAKTIAENMISNIREAFKGLLEDADWMDEPTKKIAVEKLAGIKSIIGYHQEQVTNDTNLEKEYKDVVYSANTYFENDVFRSKQKVVSQMKLLNEPIVKIKQFGITPPTWYYIYYMRRSMMLFPAGIFQPPYFSKHYPKSINFGGVGTMFGREITRGFDDYGQRYDKNGARKPWWSADILAKYKKKSKCIIDQYGKYTDPDANMKLNPSKTQGEDILDNAGLRQAFFAYRNWVKQQGKEEQKLPGIDFTPNQLFFVNFAQILCETVTSEAAKDNVDSSLSPARFRVIGPLQNSQEFAEAFKCPDTSKMNPQPKCKVF